MRPSAPLRGWLLVLPVLLLVHSLPLSAQGAALADSLRALEQARRDALLRADTVALGRLVAPEFLEISRLGTLRTRADNLGEIASGALKLNAIRYDSQTVRLYGDVAILTGISDNSGVFRGFAFSNRIRYTRVFVRRPAGWQAVLMQQTPMQ